MATAKAKKTNPLFDLQSEMIAVAKTADNPFFKSKYFDINKLLEVLKPLLNQHGLTVIQPLSHIDGVPALRTIVKDTASGEVLVDDSIPLTVIADPQKMGSSITYYRRYALQSLFLLQAEDDDANAASGNYSPAIGKNNLLTEFKDLCKRLAPSNPSYESEMASWASKSRTHLPDNMTQDELKIAIKYLKEQGKK